MANTSEYVTRLTLSLSDIEKIEEYQNATYSYGFDRPSKASLTSALGPLATILGIVAFIPSLTAIGVASAVMAAAASLTSPSQQSSIKAVVYDGYWELGRLKKMMKDSNWQMIKIDLPFLEFVDEKIRFVSGEGSIQAYYQNGVWVE